MNWEDHVQSLATAAGETESELIIYQLQVKSNLTTVSVSSAFMYSHLW